MQPLLLTAALRLESAANEGAAAFMVYQRISLPFSSENAIILAG
jgi:hypothetical protein